MKNKMGFTLVELLAVIVILAIILVIAVPKIMNTINDARNVSLESSAKMVAAVAENQYTISQTLGDEFETSNGNCLEAKWAGLNKIDYKSCSYNIENGKATVTLVGANKFEGKYVCNGTRTSASVSEEECVVNIENGALSTYIENLYNTRAVENGLINPIIENEDGTTIDTGIRYAGSDDVVKNRIWFNCKDEANGKQYGEEGYEYNSTNCEVWRIIGVFDTKSNISDSIGEKRVKIVRNTFSNNMSWDSSNKTTNGGKGINQWGEVYDSNGNIIYEGSDIMRMLNGYYVGSEDTCTYCTTSNQEVCPTTNNCKSFVTPLSSSALGMIDNALWYLGGIEGAENITLHQIYAGERRNQALKLCTSGNSCNDSVNRESTWLGKVGLIYASDYAYASSSENCASDLVENDSSCKENNWLNTGKYWTITPIPDYGSNSYGWFVNSTYAMLGGEVRSSYGIRPTLYLSSDVKMVGGDGLDEPYIIEKNN